MFSRRHLLAGAGAVALSGVGATVVGCRPTGVSADYVASVAATRAALVERPSLHELIRFATMAPSGHNTQPWRFRVSQRHVDILPDLSRRTPIVDPDDHHLFVSLGCAAETLSLAAAARGQANDIRFDAADGGRVTAVFDDGPVEASPLFAAIARRQSSRTLYDGRPVSLADLRRLEAAASTPDVALVLVTDKTGVSGVRDVIIDANSTQMADRAFIDELKRWIRFNPTDAARTGDGLYSVASGSPSLPAWLGSATFDLVFRAKAENDRYARQLNSSSGLAIFVSRTADPEHWVEAGRACQRFALQATALGLQVAFVNQPVEVARARPALAALVGMPGRRPDIVMRFGRGPTLPFSCRRPVDAVLA